MGDSSMHEIQRRLPPRFHTSANDVYITRKTQIAAQFGRCKSMLDKKSDQIVIHALGLAINRALNLALKLEDAMKGSVRLEIVTSSVGVTDDIMSLIGEGDLQTRQRTISAVHIKVSRVLD